MNLFHKWARALTLAFLFLFVLNANAQQPSTHIDLLDTFRGTWRVALRDEFLIVESIRRGFPLKYFFSGTNGPHRLQVTPKGSGESSGGLLSTVPTVIISPPDFAFGSMLLVGRLGRVEQRWLLSLSNGYIIAVQVF